MRSLPVVVMVIGVTAFAVAAVVYPPRASLTFHLSKPRVLLRTVPRPNHTTRFGHFGQQPVFCALTCGCLRLHFVCVAMVVKWCQSKHVRLITKCYPPRTANPPKPNSSELSYLTYYAYTTPSKLKKVGRYLEHRVQVGLTKGRTGYHLTFISCTKLIL